jgi:hypothetical protein
MLPAGAVSFFNLAACPTGWSELTAARGRYLVGLPSGGTLLQGVGTALTGGENRPVGQHTHGVLDPGHNHTFSSARGTGFTTTGSQPGSPEGTNSTNRSTTGISLQNAGSVAGTNAPYLQLLSCEKG